MPSQFAPKVAIVAYTPNLVWHTSYTEVYSGFIQSLDADTGILGTLI